MTMGALSLAAWLSTCLRRMLSLLVGLALSLVHPFSARSPALPGNLGRTGSITLTASRDDSEALRDFARVWLANGGDLFLACGGSELITLQRPGSADGTASAGEAAAIAEEEFCGAVHKAVVQHIDEAFDERKQRDLVRRLMSQMTVDPTIQIVTQHGLLPSVVQPKFVVLVSKQQVRVATYAFIGSPVCGDRPNRKWTPFLMRMVTCNLVELSSAVDISYAVSSSGSCRSVEERIRAELGLIDAALTAGEWSVYSCR